MTVGERIKARRKAMGMRADELAEKLGVSQATIYRYESGFIEKLDASYLKTIASALNTTPGYLMGWDDEENDTDDMDELTALREDLRRRPEMRTLFSLTRRATPKQVRMVVKMLEAMRDGDEDE